MKNKKFAIIAKIPEANVWEDDIKEIQTPCTVSFAISSNDFFPDIKRTIWDLGNGNKFKNIKNKSNHPYSCNVDYKYRKSNDLTITVSASVYVEDEIFIPSPLTITTSNEQIKLHYIDPEVFKQQIIEFYETDVFSDELAESIYKIASKLAFANNFINYTYRDDMVGDALLRMVMAVRTKKFDPEKGNPFSYFTKIAYHAFCNRIKIEKKEKAQLLNYQSKMYDNLKDAGLLPYNSDNISSNQYEEDMENQYVEDIRDRYEQIAESDNEIY